MLMIYCETQLQLKSRKQYDEYNLGGGHCLGRFMINM